MSNGKPTPKNKEEIAACDELKAREERQRSLIKTTDIVLHNVKWVKRFDNEWYLQGTVYNKSPYTLKSVSFKVVYDDSAGNDRIERVTIKEDKITTVPDLDPGGNPSDNRGECSGYGRCWSVQPSYKREFITSTTRTPNMRLFSDPRVLYEIATVVAAQVKE